MRNKFMFGSLVLAAFFSLAACSKKDSAPSTTSTFSGTMSGANETPANSSAGTGTASFSYDSYTKILTGTVDYSGVTATAAHIHTGAAGVAGSVVFDLGATLTSPIAFISVALDATQESDLMNNLYYVNIHSAAYPGGEIRAQLIKQ